MDYVTTLMQLLHALFGASWVQFLFIIQISKHPFLVHQFIEMHEVVWTEMTFCIKLNSVGIKFTWFQTTLYLNAWKLGNFLRSGLPYSYFGSVFERELRRGKERYQFWHCSHLTEGSVWVDTVHIVSNIGEYTLDLFKGEWRKCNNRRKRGIWRVNS